MTKTLTEQWKSGKLKDGSFYIERFGQYMMAHCIGRVLYLENHDVIWSPHNVKVLAPVPSYDKVKEMSQKIERLEFDNEALEMAHNEGKEINAELVSKTEQLEKRLEIATKALERYSKDDYYSEGGGRSVNPYPHIARKALKEMEGVK